MAREHELMPKTVDRDFWREYLTEHPDVMYRLLGDLYQASRAVAGRRKPPTTKATLDDIYQLVTPQFSNQPFGEAVKAALGSRSVSWLAQQIHVHHSQVIRLMSGEREIVSIRDPAGSMFRLEAVARALNVHPSYFLEWRRLWILSLIDDAFAEQPNLSIGVYKRFAGQLDPHTRPVNGR